MQIDEDYGTAWYWRNWHSGSEAIDRARALLANPDLVGPDIGMTDLVLIAAELIFRVTGEQLSPPATFIANLCENAKILDSART